MSNDFGACYHEFLYYVSIVTAISLAIFWTSDRIQALTTTFHIGVKLNRFGLCPEVQMKLFSCLG